MQKEYSRMDSNCERHSKRSFKHLVTQSACLLFAMVLLGQCGCRALKKFDLSEKLLGKQSKEEWEDDVDTFDPLQRKAKNNILLQDLKPSQIAATIKSRTIGGANPEKAEEEFAIAKQYYEQAKAQRQKDDKQQTGAESAVALFKKAGNHFRIAAAHMPDSAIEKDALFFQGESYFFADAYPQANRAYEWLLEKYPGNHYLDKVESRRFSIALYWLQMADQHQSWMPNIKFGDERRPTQGLVNEARRIFHRIRMDDPTGKLADDATLALANSYFKAERYTEAAETYQDLRTAYPGSKHQFHAHLFELKARLASYQGESYDGEPLKKADQILKTMVRQFPDQIQDHREYLAKEGSRIREMLAARDLSMGQYYEKLGENRAATLYYKKVAEDYGDTQLAARARQIIPEIAALPPKPKEHAKWLSDLLPDANAIKPLVAAGDNESIFR